MAHIHELSTVHGDFREERGGKPGVLDAPFALSTGEVGRYSRREHRVRSDCGFRSGEYA